ncbi:MAG TPA: type II secretion system protein GspH [Leucothrix mucor]|nr:type II secretion system protein GspH [Leucothrix mucor]
MSIARYSLAKKSGFTLLEIMIVVVIVGLLMSAVVPMVSKSSDDLLKEQADRFSALVKLAQDESILQSRQLGLKIREESYSFLQQDDEKWIAFEEGPFRQRNLSGGTKITLYLDDVDVSLDEGAEGDKKTKPQVFILSSGEMTPFSAQFAFRSGGNIKVSFDAIGNVKKVVQRDDN